MRETVDAVVAVLPWWVWLLAAVAAAAAFAVSSAAALAMTSAYGSNYRALSNRQRKMGRIGSRLSLLAMPASAFVGVLALAAAAWRLFA